MAEVNESASTWTDELARLVANQGHRSYNSSPAVGGGGGKPAGEEDNWRLHVVEFARGVGEMSVEFGKGVRDVVNQNLLREDSFLVRKLRGPCKRVRERLRFLNECLPEDRDPVHAWSVILLVALLAFVAVMVNTNGDASILLVKKLHIHPPSATRIFLPDGRYLAYKEQGVPADQARYSIIASHSFLSSRLAGIPGIRSLLLQEFGVRLVTYDLPGFGESDPHPNRNLESSALDLLHLSYGVNITDKFWVLGFSGGCIHTWAALRYIPDRIAGAIIVAPMVNPYEPSMSKEELRRTWATWSTRKKLMYFLARKFPLLLRYIYHRRFLSGNHGRVDKWLSLSLGDRDRALIEHPMFEEFWQRDVEESVRQGKVDPFVQESVLQVSNWGFRLGDLKMKKKRKRRSFMQWVKSVYNQAEESMNGFLGPIHIWQGMDDKVVPPSMSDFAFRVLPDAMVHKLLYEGHFSYFYFCDDCHKQLFSIAFGTPQGPLPSPQVSQVSATQDENGTEEATPADKVVPADEVIPANEAVPAQEVNPPVIPQDIMEVTLDDAQPTEYNSSLEL